MDITIAYEEVTNELSFQLGKLQTELTIERIKNQKLQNELLKIQDQVNKPKHEDAE